MDTSAGAVRDAESLSPGIDAEASSLKERLANLVDFRIGGGPVGEFEADARETSFACCVDKWEEAREGMDSLNELGEPRTEILANEMGEPVRKPGEGDTCLLRVLEPCGESEQCCEMVEVVRVVVTE